MPNDDLGSLVPGILVCVLVTVATDAVAHRELSPGGVDS